MNIKSFTSLEQSKILSEILSHESADMCYKCIEDDPYDIVCKPYSKWKEEYKGLLVRGDANVIPCWSLAALVSVLPDDCGIDKEDGKYVASYIISDECGSYTEDNPIDACVAMIEYLHKINLL